MKSAHVFFSRPLPFGHELLIGVPHENAMAGRSNADALAMWAEIIAGLREMADYLEKNGDELEARGRATLRGTN